MGICVLVGCGGISGSRRGDLSERRSGEFRRRRHLRQAGDDAP
jgi:hypothetical protein